MSTSYNGWPIVPSSATVRALVPGTVDARIEILRGEVATVLNAWAALWHRNVRKIDTYRPRDYWGWSPSNSHSTSCHLSGTAIDLNATTLPFKARTMPAAQRATVDKMVRDFRGVVAWGGHWTNPIDEMHAEIAVRPGDKRLTDLARDLSAGYLNVWPATPAPPATGVTTVSFTDADRTMLREVHAALLAPRVSLINSKASYDVPEFLRYIDAATFRTEAKLDDAIALAKQAGK